MKLSIRGVGFVGAGLSDWLEARAALSDGQPPGHVPLEELGRALKADRLPRTERRRAGKSTRLAMTACWQAVEDAGVDPATLPMIFASSTGDTEVLTHSCAALAEPERAISPIRFHNSVHNAPSGYWSIAVGSREPATAIAAHGETAAVGLLEAAMQAVLEHRPVLYVVHDLPFPEPLCQVEPIPEAMAIALVLAPGGASSDDRLELVHTSNCEYCDNTMDEAGWEHLRASVPAARLLPLLDAMARGESRSLFLGLDSAAGLALTYKPGESTHA
ncbi:beta-ketoacyl synthase chain length factor [Guyparkeria sp.]|uniref:beta-ketoacyl synthase chain length factor n=1 Tax=Guyparkeria sp. TaxID=2035736 RepID=UPI0035628AFB